MATKSPENSRFRKYARKLQYLSEHIPGPYKAIIFPSPDRWVRRHPVWVAESCVRSCNSVCCIDCKCIVQLINNVLYCLVHQEHSLISGYVCVLCSYTVKTKYRNFKTNIPRKWYIGASIPISTFMPLWANYIFPWSVCLFCERNYVDGSWDYINRSQTHECWNWGWCRAFPRKGIHK